MLHQHQSRRAHMLKHLIILPVLALFLLAFNTRTVYVPENAPADTVTLHEGKTIELIIDKDTSDEELQEIKTKLASDGMDFSYTAVRNAQGEIIGLDIDIQGTTEKGGTISGSYSQSEDTPIEPTLIRLDDAGSLFIGQANKGRKMTYTFAGDGDEKQMQVWVHRDGDGEEETIEVREKDGKNVFIVNGEEVDAQTLKEGGKAKRIMVKLKELQQDNDMDIQIHEIKVSGEDGEEHLMEWHSTDSLTKTIDIKDINGKKTILVNGKVVSEAEWEKMKEDGEAMNNASIHHSTVIQLEDDKKTKAGNIVIIRDSDEEEDIEAVGSSGSFFYIDSEKGAKPLFFIDGKKASAKAVGKLDPDTIAHMEVLKGKAATDKYGKKAEDGVILITTKK